MNILLLEDDFTLSSEIEKFFKSKNVKCDTMFDGNLALNMFKKDTYNLVILDINVPGQNGFHVCQGIRELDKNVPIIMLTAFGEIEDKLKAFNFGADDYIVKPFHFEELFARVNALLKRREEAPVESDIVVGDLVISTYNLSVFRAGKELSLTPKEFQLLSLLASASGRIVTKNTISEKLWDYNVVTNQNTIEVYINSLRKKIDKDHEQKLIHTKVGYGYFLKVL
jgi:DNA-binding response OmpR family regulator